MRDISASTKTNQMKLVVNASPLIILGKIGLIEVLPLMVDNLVIPMGVVSEVEKHKDDASIWVSKHKPSYSKAVDVIPQLIAAWDLGLGESEVIAFALQNNAYTVAIDDKAARNCAMSMNINVIGTIGLIVLAKRKKHIIDVEPYLNNLIGAGYRISQSLIDSAIRSANDSEAK